MKKLSLFSLSIGILIGALVFSGTYAIAANVTASQTTAKVIVDGKEVKVDAYNIEGSNYFKLRDFTAALDVGVWFEQSSNTIYIETDKGYDANYTGAKNEQPANEQSANAVIMEKNGVKITFLGIALKATGLNGYDIMLKIENSSPKNYTVQIRDLSINGMMLYSSIFSSDVVSGKAANDAIWIYGLEDAGISLPFETIEFKFHIFDSDTWDGDFDSDVIRINP